MIGENDEDREEEGAGESDEGKNLEPEMQWKVIRALWEKKKITNNFVL